MLSHGEGKTHVRLLFKSDIIFSGQILYMAEKVTATDVTLSMLQGQVTNQSLIKWTTPASVKETIGENMGKHMIRLA